jgi:hypothetical protein
MGQLLPIRSNPRAPPLQPPHYRDHQLPAGCCVFSLRFGHLRPKNIRLSILNFGVCCLAPLKQANQPWRHQTRPRLLCMGP